MVILPNGDIFVATPRTASRAIMEALMRAYPDAHNTYPGDHHVHPDEVPKGGRVFGMIRDPYTHLVSWWNNTWGGDRSTFLKFLYKYSNVRFLPPEGFPPSGYRLNMYGDVITDFYLFEDGPEELLKGMGVEGGFVDVVGASQKRPRLYNNGRFVEDVEKVYAKDLELYRRVLKEKGR